MRRFITAILCIILLTLLFTACSEQAEQTEITDTVVVDANYSYAGYDSYETALNDAEIVVYGTIKEIGKAFKYDYGSGLSKVENVEYYTPITIEIEECIKGDPNLKTVVYYALGGVVDGTMYDYLAFDTEDFVVGDKLLVFLGKTGPGYGVIAASCVISEDKSGKATRAALGDNAEADTLAEQLELVRNASVDISEVQE